jgi:hypothetical protein
LIIKQGGTGTECRSDNLHASARGKHRRRDA